MCNGPVLIWWMKCMSIYRICMGITHCTTLWMTAELFWNNNNNNKKTSEGSDVRSSKKRENSKSASNHNASCCPVTEVFKQEKKKKKKKTRITRKQHVENISQMYDKNSYSVKEAVTRKQAQDIDLAAREAHYHATCWRDYTREDDRHQKPSKILKPFSVHHSVCYAQNRLEIKRLPR